MKNKYLKVTLLSLLMACILVVPQIISGNGILSIYSDFNFQQVPFTMAAIEGVQTGNTTYSWVNDIGTSFLGSYGYYNLTSPFFLITLLFPSTWFPYLVGPMLILKLVIAALLAYVFLERYVKNKDYAILGALLYAFSGFQLTNLLFHFQDVIALFPLLLIALDKTMYENKKGLFLFAVAINAITNYFFFIGQVVFLGLYFIIKWITKEYKMSWKKFFQLAIESILGVGIAAVILIPSIIFVLGNPRVDNIWTLKDAIMPRDYQIVEILRGMLFGPDIMSQRALFNEYLFTSAELYLPFVGIILFSAYLWKKPKSWISLLLFVCFIFMIIPILNSTFFALTTTYYARWFYMAILIMSLASIKALEENIKLENGYLTAGVLLGAFTFLTLLFSLNEKPVVYHLSYFLVNVLIALFGYIGLYFVFKFKNNKKWFSKLLILGVLISISLQGFVFYFKYNAISDPKIYNETYLNNEVKLDYIKDGERTDTNVDGYCNLSYILNVPNLKNFNTTISPNAFSFYYSLNIYRDVRTDIGETHPKLRDFLSVRYFISQAPHKMDLKVVEETKTYTIYENNNFVSMGIPYDYYISKEDFFNLLPEQREDVLIYAAVLDEEQISKYKYILEKLDLSKLDKLNEKYEEYISSLKDKTSKEFKYTKKGANLTINAEEEKLYILSIPHDKGWTIKVNNTEVKYENVDNGLIGLHLNSGENKIVMEYKDRGLTLGIIVSIISLASTIAYLIIKKD